MEKQLRLFKDLFQPFQNISILQISKEISFLDKTLKEVVEPLEGELEYINFINESSAKLKAVARKYEYILLCDILFYCENKNTILKLMYKALENSANIIILEKNQTTIWMR